jgi:hypothetical protein
MCCSQPPFVFDASLLAVVVEAEVGDEAFAHDVAERVFQFHGLDEEVVLGVDAVSTARGFEVEAQPLLEPKPNCASRNPSGKSLSWSTLYVLGQWLIWPSKI